MSTYLIYVLAAVSAAFLLFIAVFLVRRDRKSAVTALLSLPLCILLGFVLSKLFYVLLMELGNILQWGEWDALFSMKPKTFCFVGGAVGVWLGVLLSTKLTKNRPAGTVLDAFTVPGALLIAGFRLAEMELGSLGTGRFIEIPDSSSYLILAVFNKYGEPHVAVFIWEAVVALVVALLTLIRTEAQPGQRFRTAVFRLCICQILLENMRSQNLKWGFVCVEQLMCAVIIMVLTVLACLRVRNCRNTVRFLPAFAMLLCFGAIVGTEFLRQRSPSRFMGMHGGYLIMSAILAVMLLIYSIMVRHSSAASSGQESSKG